MDGLENTPRKRGRPRLSAAEKAARGTIEQTRLEPREKRPQPRPEPELAPPAPRDYPAVARAYADSVRSGLIPACKWVRLAVARQARDLVRASVEGADWPYVWSDEAATAACAFVERLPHVEGRWTTPTIRLEPAQVFLLALLFGWRHRGAPGRRRFTTLYWELGRKGAKSTLMAAIALYHLVAEDEPGPSVVCGATTGSQARIVFGIANQMIARSTYLRGLGLRPFVNSICLMPEGATIGTMKPINARASTQDGLNPSCIVLDESHAQTFELHDVLKSAQGARANPLLLCPTTAGYNQLSIGYALRTTLCKVLEGILDAEHLLGLIYTLDEGDDWRDERLWIKANPMLGTTPLLDQMRRYCLDAQQTPGLEGEFRVKCCSQWANAGSAWLSMQHWDACADPGLRIDAFAGQPCWIGGDLAQRDDLAAVAYVFQRDEQLVAFVRCYLPEEVVAERARTVPEYRLWKERGELVLTPGDYIDYGIIEGDLRAACLRYQVKDICFDQFGSAQITSSLAASGYPARMESKNAKNMTAPARELEGLVTRRRFRHDGNSCLKWQASNVIVSRRIDDSILPKKESAESPNKIDAIDALLLAIGGWLRAQATTPSYAVLVVG
jgi:phage terminase large subunit-like protein